MFRRSSRGVVLIRRAALTAALILGAQHAMAETIRMWTFLNPAGKTGREVVLKQLVEGFEAANPGLKINVEVQDYRTLGTKFFAAHQTGTAPDVVMLNVPNVTSAIKLGAFANLDDIFIKNWSKEEIADFDDPYWRYGAKPGAHYEIFLTRGTDGMLYRTDLLKQAGIDPKSLTSWDKFIAAAQKLTVKDASGKVTQWGFGQMLSGSDPVTPVMFSVLMESEGTIFDKDFHANWATPGGLRGIQLQSDLIGKYQVTPETALSIGQDEGMEQFGAGRWAMVRGTTPRIAAMMQLLGPGKVGFIPTPTFTPGAHAPAACSGWAAAIWSGSKIKDLAGQWVQYLSSKKAAVLWMTVGGQEPMRKSALVDSLAFLADPGNAYMVDVAEDMKADCWLPPEGAGPPGWHEGLNNALQDVIIRHIDPKVALENAAAAFDRSHRH